jgi:hypothetical protein
MAPTPWKFLDDLLYAIERMRVKRTFSQNLNTGEYVAPLGHPQHNRRFR